jgi:integrase
MMQSGVWRWAVGIGLIWLTWLAVHAFLPTGAQGQQPLDEICGAQGLAIDSQGNIYLALVHRDRIQKLSAQGEPLAQWGTRGSGPGQFESASGIAVDVQGHVYVTDSRNASVQKFSAQGEPLALWGSEGSDPGQFSFPNGIAVDAHSNVYIADTRNARIQKLSPVGEPLAQWGVNGSGPGEFSYPYDVAVDDHGNIYVADYSNARIQKLSPLGEPLAQWGGKGEGPGQFRSPIGIAVDSQGNVYVADTFLQGDVQKLSPIGEPLARWRSEAIGNGLFWNPRDVVVDSQGNIYVAENNAANTPDSRIRKLSPSGKTRREVQEKLTAALRAHHQGLPIDQDERETVGKFLDRWLDDIASSIRASTLKSYRDIVRVHLQPELGHVRLTKLTPAQVQTMLTSKTASGLSPRRVQYIRAVLRSALAQALDWSLVARNAAELTRAPKVVYDEVKPLSVEQARALLAAVRDDRLEALYVLALSTGMRQGELLGLRWEDVDLEQRTLRVSMTLHRVNGEYQLQEPKTQRSRRAIVLPRVAADALGRHQGRQNEERALTGDWERTDLVFTTDRGAPLHGSSITHRFQDLLERAGLPRQRFHDLRHGCATLLLAQGVQGRSIMGALGHSQIGLTMNTYGHLTPSMEADTAARMDAILLGDDIFSPRLAADLAASLESAKEE